MPGLKKILVGAKLKLFFMNFGATKCFVNQFTVNDFFAVSFFSHSLLSFDVRLSDVNNLSMCHVSLNSRW